MSECRYCGGECETSDEYMCDGYAGDIDNLYGDDDAVEDAKDYTLEELDK